MVNAQPPSHAAASTRPNILTPTSQTTARTPLDRAHRHCANAMPGAQSPSLHHVNATTHIPCQRGCTGIPKRQFCLAHSRRRSHCASAMSRAPAAGCPEYGDTVIRASRSSPHGFVTPYVPAGPRTPPSQSACIYHRQQFVVLLHIGPALAGHSLVAVPALASRPRSEPARQRIIGGNTNVRVRPYVANTSSRNIGGTSAGMFTSASRMYSSLADLGYISR